MKLGRVIAGGALWAIGIATAEVPFIGFPLCVVGGAMVGSGLFGDDPDEQSSPNPERPIPPSPEWPSPPIPAAPGAYGVKFGEPLNVDADQKARRARVA